MSKKEILARFFERSGLVELVRALRQLFVRRVRILAYHRVYAMPEGQVFPYDPELVSATPEEFQWQMSYLKKHYHPVTFEWVLEKLEKGERLPANTVIVTFDDGHLDNYTEAFPVLASLGIPATIFLSTDYIGAPGEYWFEEVSRRICLCKAGEYHFDSIEESFVVEEPLEKRRATVITVLDRLKNVCNRKRLAFMQELEVIGGSSEQWHRGGDRFTFSASLDWDQVREMAAAGIEFGSHSLGHPIMSQLEPDELYREIHDSKTIIEEQLGKPVRVFAYPVGKANQMNPDTEKVLEESAYDLATSYICGEWTPGVDNSYEIKRIPVERYTSRSFFKSMLALPEVFHYR